MPAVASVHEPAVAESSLDRFIGPALRSWPVVVLFLLYGLFIGAVLPAVRPVKHTATAEVLVRPLVADPTVNTRPDQLVSLDTEAVVIASDEVLTKAADLTGHTVANLRSNLRVIAVPSSQVLKVSETQRAGKEARTTADAVAKTYLVQRQERAKQLIANEIESVTAQSAALDARLRDLSAKLAPAAQGSAERASLQSLQTSAAQQLSAVQTRLLSLQRAQIDSGEVLRTPDGSAASGFGRTTTVPAGALIGLLSGLALAFLLDRLSRTIRRPSDAIRATGQRILAIVGDRELDPGLADNVPEEEDANAYRRALLAIEPGDDAVIAIVGTAGTGEAGPVSSSLATVAARGGTNVALLLLGASADKRPVGMTELGAVLGAQVSLVRAPALQVGRGKVAVYVGDPSLEELATPMALSAAAARLRAMHDLVVVEIDDPLGSALAEGWIRAADRTALAARRKLTRTGHLRKVVAHLEDAGHAPVGTVLIG
jgi:uncharacterized protein involved in exopolysaccharide biosynthesis